MYGDESAMYPNGRNVADHFGSDTSVLVTANRPNLNAEALRSLLGLALFATDIYEPMLKSVDPVLERFFEQVNQSQEGIALEARASGPGNKPLSEQPVEPGSEPGSVTVQDGAKPSPAETKAADAFANAGYDVVQLNELNTSRTPDLNVEGVGTVDVYTPEKNPGPDTITDGIASKGSQTQNVLVQGDFSEADKLTFAARVFGKIGSALNIESIFFQDSSGALTVIKRP